MSEWLLPLEGKTPRLLGYPTGDAFRRTLDRLQTNLAQSFLSHYKRRLNGKVWVHSTRPALEADLAGWGACVSAYVQVAHKLPKALKDFQAFLIFSKESFEPAFASVAKGALLEVWRETIERAEKGLTRTPFRSPGDPRPRDWWQVRETLAWTRLVRLCIACAMVRALDYQGLWKTVDGDAGWWLSEVLGDRVRALTDLAPFKDMESLRASRTTFLREGLGLADDLPSRAGLESLPRRARAWREHCRMELCPVRELGVEYPWTFEPIRLAGPSDAGKAVSVQFFARAAAIERLQRIKALWAERRRLLIKDGRIREPKQFEFTLEAGSLRHGGSHPPHQTHRNGSVFDLDLTDLPDLSKEFGAAPLQSLGRPVPGTGADEYLEPDGSDVLLPLSAPVKRPQEWNFPADRRDREFMTVAQAFTECIYLTFPFSIIYASGLVTKGAKSRLLARLDLLEEATDLNDRRTRRLIGDLREQIQAIIPDPYRNMNEATETSVRSSHRNHWHVTYDPDALGDEDGPISQDHARAAKAAALFREMDALGLAARLFAVRLEDEPGALNRP